MADRGTATNRYQLGSCFFITEFYRVLPSFTEFDRVMPLREMRNDDELFDRDVTRRDSREVRNQSDVIAWAGPALIDGGSGGVAFFRFD